MGSDAAAATQLVEADEEESFARWPDLHAETRVRAIEQDPHLAGPLKTRCTAFHLDVPGRAGHRP